jgi:cell wall assembly regulator SMI1
LPALHDFSTWAPFLRAIRRANAGRITRSGLDVAGHVSAHGGFGANASLGDFEIVHQAVETVRAAATKAGKRDVPFTVHFAPDGRTELRLSGANPAVRHGVGQPVDALLLVEGAVPEPWRRLPETFPGTGPAPSADAGLLERTLRARVLGLGGVTEEELAATEARLGIALPEEVKALHRVAGRPPRPDDDRAREAAERAFDVVGMEFYALEEMFVADAASRRFLWQFAAKEAAVTLPGDAVQGLPGSPGWLVVGTNGGGDEIAVDLTPGQAGHLGQLILISHESDVGAELLAPSLTDLVLHGERDLDGGSRREDLPHVAHVNHAAVTSIEAAADPRLEVLSIGVWDGAPFRLTSVLGLPRLRTLAACPGTLADPLEIAGLRHLEYLALGTDDWRVLLDADAVPRTLLAAGFQSQGRPDPRAVTEIADRLLALWGLPLTTGTVLTGDLSEA